MKKKFVVYSFLFLIAFVMIPSQAIASQSAPSSIKIGLYYDKTAKHAYELYSDSGFIIISKTVGEEKPFEISDRVIQVAFSTNQNPNQSNFNNVSVTSKEGEFKLELPSDMDNPIIVQNRKQEEVVALDGKKYRGRMLIWPSDYNRLTVVNELGMEEYLYGVLPKEMPPSWPAEALKAQAVASRTYAACNIAKWDKFGFDLTDGVLDQVYAGYDVENKQTNMAVDETRGKLIIYAGEPIQAFYHSDSGGITENGSETMSVNLPYLKSVRDVMETNSPTSMWEVSYTPEYINRQIKSLKGIDLGDIYDLSIIERTSSNRVSKLLVSGTLGQKEFTGSDIRTIFNLKSTLFDVQIGNFSLYIVSGQGPMQTKVLNNAHINTAFGITKVNLSNLFFVGSGGCSRQIHLGNTEGFKIVGRGLGHGLGMSQWGARAMAENGYNYIDILQHYYNDVTIK